MPSIGASDRASNFENALKHGKEIPWEEVVCLDNIIGSELRTEEDKGSCCQGIISDIRLENGIMNIMCPWILKTPMDEDGDPVGDYMSEQWEVLKDPKLPLVIHVPKSRYRVGQEVMLHTVIGSFSSDQWAVRTTDTVISFWSGSGIIYLKGHDLSIFNTRIGLK